MKTIKIVIVGAGFCGMVSAYYLTRYLEKGLEADIVIVDPGEIGENASGIAVGLLHAYAGAHAKLVKGGVEGLATTLDLVQAVDSSALEKTGMLRVAVSDEQKSDFRQASEKYDGVRWCDSDECQKICPGLVAEPGIFIENAYVMNTKQYLKALWQECREKGVRWQKHKISSLRELDNCNAIIVANGADIVALPEFSHLPISPVKGQILKFRWPTKLPRLTIPVNSKAYLLQTDDGIVGATFERSFRSKEPDVAYALEYLKPKMVELFPALFDVEITDCLSGIRASTPNHQPFIGRTAENIWVITGMGSKGLLFHAFYARKLVDDVVCSLVPFAFS